MADISSELQTIATATKGELVRDAVVDAITKMKRQMEPPPESE